jgi:predicted enzyme related to lactoylglutathione lyase
MATRLDSLVIDAADPHALARFWSAALDWEITEEEPDDVTVEPRDLGLQLVFGPVPDEKVVKNRLHLDLASSSPEDRAAIVDRVRQLGAVPVDIGQRDTAWTVLADPEGNEFCVLEPRDAYAGVGAVAALVIDAADPVALAPFWAGATGWTVVESMEKFASLRAPSGTGPWLELLKVPDVKQVKNRLHIDVRPNAGDNQAAEVARLRELGAEPADVGQGDQTWVVLADPEGNEFCVLSSPGTTPARGSPPQ